MRTGSAEEATDKIKESRAAIEALEPATAQLERRFEWILPDGRPVEKTYIQAELGMFPVQEFTTRITEVIDSFVKGDMGIKLGDLFRGDVQMPTSFDASTVNGVVEENVQVIMAFVKLVQMLPDFQLDVLCLSLGIPRMEREWAKGQMQEPPHRGGLSVDEGFELLKVFIQQNAQLLRETLLGKARELVDVFRLEVLQQEIVDTTAEEDQTSSSTTPTTPTSDEQPSPATSPGGTPSSTSSQPIPASV